MDQVQRVQIGRIERDTFETDELVRRVSFFFSFFLNALFNFCFLNSGCCFFCVHNWSVCVWSERERKDGRR